MLWQIRLSVCHLWRACTLWGLTFRGYFCTIAYCSIGLWLSDTTHAPKITKIIQGDHPLRANLPNRRVAVRLFKVAKPSYNRPISSHVGYHLLMSFLSAAAETDGSMGLLVENMMWITRDVSCISIVLYPLSMSSNQINRLPFLRASVTRWHCIKTAEFIVKLSSPHDSPFILALCISTGIQLVLFAHLQLDSRID